MTPKKDIRRAVVYTRVSFVANRTKENRQESSAETSPERQEQERRGYCTSNGQEIVAIHTDRCVSAFSGADRPGWAKVVRAIEVDEVDVVVVHALDRAGRNLIELLQFGQTCHEHDVSFVSVSQDINSGGQYGRVISADRARLGTFSVD